MTRLGRCGRGAGAETALGNTAEDGSTASAVDPPLPLPVREADAAARGSTRATGATKRYPRPGTVWMQLPCCRSASRMQRSAET
jgi:hypothetical protein